ncbi:MAG: hypothetical protein ABI627_14150 [Polyangiaceae bacterium]
MRLCAACAVLLLLLSAQPCRAAGTPVLVEISDGAETLLDARAARHLVALELSDIHVLELNNRAPMPLFFRVVQQGLDLRVELWQRGEFHGARLVSGTTSGGQLSARRVALAAAELARRLHKKRHAQVERERAEALTRAEARAQEARHALDGPLAARPSLAFASVGSMAATLAGPRLLGEWTFARHTRLDAGFAWLAGSAPDAAKAEWLELSVSPSRRLQLADGFDLDLGVNLAAAWVRLAHVRGVDAILDQSETWSARATALVRLEPMLSRQLRLSIGAEAGLLLREIPFQPLSGGTDRLRGMWLGLDLGVVFTPR